MNALLADIHIALVVQRNTEGYRRKITKTKVQKKEPNTTEEEKSVGLSERQSTDALYATRSLGLKANVYFVLLAEKKRKLKAEKQKRKAYEMDREKQIEEMAREMCHLSGECKTCQICNERYNSDDDDELCYFQCVAKEIINHSYRKQSDVAKEIFEELDKLTYQLLNDADYTMGDIVYDITELKNKYL